MKIVIVGDGKVGGTLAEQLSLEGHDITDVYKRQTRQHGQESAGPRYSFRQPQL